MPPPKFPQLYDLMDTVWLQMYKEGHPDFLNKMAEEICRQANICDPSEQRAIRMFVRNRHYRVLMPMLRGDKPRTCNGYKRNATVQASQSVPSKRGFGQPVFPGTEFTFCGDHHSHKNGNMSSTSSDSICLDTDATPNIKEEPKEMSIYPELSSKIQNLDRLSNSPFQNQSQMSSRNLSSPTVITSSTGGSGSGSGNLINVAKPQQVSMPNTNQMSPPGNPVKSSLIKKHLTNNSSISRFPYHNNRNFGMPMFQMFPISSTSSQPAVPWPFTATTNVLKLTESQITPNTLSNTDGDKRHKEENVAIDYSLHSLEKSEGVKLENGSSAHVQGQGSAVIWDITADEMGLKIKPKLDCLCGVDKVTRSSQTDCPPTTAVSDETESSSSTTTTTTTTGYLSQEMENFERELVNWSMFQSTSLGSVTVTNVQQYAEFLAKRYTPDLVLSEAWVLRFCLRHKLDVET